MTADERERRIRVRNARHATPDCLCDWCFILGRLDAERKRGDQIREVLDDRRLWIFADGYDKSIEIGVIRHIVDKPEDDQ